MFGFFKSSNFSKNKKTNTDPKAVEEFLTRGVEEVFIKDNLRQRLLSGNVLRVKLGIDPTSPFIHIGRATVLWKLRKLQDMGHHIILLVGDFTATIGDASDKLSKRPMLSLEKVQENMRDYKKIVGKIIDLSKVEFVYNSKWLSALGFSEICNIAETFTVQQMIARRNFSERIEKGEEISVREFMYPLMQGYDSVVLRADLELGGFDQLFNLKAGRSIQKHYGQKEQDILTVSMLPGTDGRKMSSSWGNIISITAEPDDMFGKVMSIKDDLIVKYFTLCTSVSMDEVARIDDGLKSGSVHPKETKLSLAKEIVSMYHGKDMAEKAMKNFEKTFSQGGLPENIETYTVLDGTILADFLVEKAIVDSKSDWRRLIDEGAVKIIAENSEEKLSDYKYVVSRDAVFKIGKRRFVSIKLDA